MIARHLSLIAAGIVAMGLAAGAAEAGTISLTGSGSTNQNYFSGTTDGVSWKVTGQYWSNNQWCASKVNRTSDGMGVERGTDWIGEGERLGLLFTPVITLDTLTFTLVDPHDNFFLWLADGTKLGGTTGFALDDNRTVTINLADSQWGLSTAQRQGGQFYIGAAPCDSFRIAGASFTGTVQVVPLPAAVWGGMMLLGGMGATRFVRRRKRDSI